MRICQVIESTSGGSVQVALDLAKGLSDRGDNVTFLYSPLRADSLFFNTLAQMPNVSFVPVAMHRSLGFHDLFSLLDLKAAIKEHGPFDIIHAHSSKAGGLVRLLRRLLPHQTRVLYTPHAFVTLSPESSKAYALIERFLSRQCDAVIAVSGGERDHALQFLEIEPRRVHVIPNGIDTTQNVSRPQARARLGLGDDERVVGFVGRFVPQKNTPRLIEAFALAAQACPALRFAVVGGGEGTDSVTQALAHYALREKTSLWLDQAARPLSPGFDVLCCSSDYEGISLVFLESLAAGVPIVTTPVAGAAETVTDGETGFVAADFTAQALADCLIRWAQLPDDRRAHMSRAALEKSKAFTRDKMVDAHRSLYQSLL